MVSVIIPIYNVQNFINSGIQQILHQSYKDFEVILVDDGSTDGSLEECRKWAVKDTRIRVFHQRNEGAGSARNHGIEEAQGEYLYFFDIDDKLAENTLEYNVKIMQQKAVDMIVFGYNNIETTYKSKTTVSFPDTEIISNTQLRNIYVDEFIVKVNGFPWNKFYRKSFLNRHKLRFENQRIQQDEVFNLLCYQHIQKMYLSSKVLYTYYVYEKGNTRSCFIPDRFDIYKSVRQHFERLKILWKIKDQRFEDYLNNRFFVSVLQCMQFNLSHPDCPWTMEQKRQEMNRIMSDSETISAFAYAKGHIHNLEQRLYMKACQNKNMRQLNFYTNLFHNLHKLRKKII